MGIMCLSLNFLKLLLEREINNMGLLFHLFMHSLIDSYLCPDGIKLKPGTRGGCSNQLTSPDTALSFT